MTRKESYKDIWRGELPLRVPAVTESVSGGFSRLKDPINQRRFPCQTPCRAGGFTSEIRTKNLESILGGTASSSRKPEGSLLLPVSN